MFEREYMDGKEQDIPAIFNEIAETAAVTPFDVREAVLGALMAADVHSSPQERQALYRKMLYYVVEDYANEVGLAPDRVSDALVAAAQASEPIKEELTRRRRVTT